MAKFNYIAVDSSGKEVRGSIEAPSQAQAVAKIRDKQLFPTAIGEAGGGGGSSAAKGASKAAASGGRKASKNIEIKLPKVLRPKVKTKDLTTLTRQLATLVDAGLPLLRGLRVLQRQSENATLKEALGKIGTVRSVSLQYCQLSSKYPAYLEGRNPNIFNPEMKAGCLMDIGVYPVYLAAALYGMPEKITSDAVFLPSGADASGCAILKYDGFTVDLHYSKVAQSYAPSEFLGDRGTVTVGAVSQLTGVRLIADGKETMLVPDNLTRDEVMGAEANVFAELVKNGPSPVYAFAKETSLTVRRITDEIRKQNGFPF